MSGFALYCALCKKVGAEDGLDSKYGEAATLAHIEAAIDCLSDAEWLRLRKMAASHLWGTRFADPDELVNETITRLAEGTRHWPTGMKFVPWMDSAMKSVADGLRQLRSRKLEALAADVVECDDPEEALDIFASDSQTPLDSMLTEEARNAATDALEKIAEYFKDDQDVTWILMGIEDGLKADEIRDTAGMTQTQYETARRRMRRGIEKLFPARREL